MIKINFRRDPNYTSGNKNHAWCSIPRPEGGYAFFIIPKKHGDGASGHNVIYAMILKLCAAGYEGREFTAHDGRIPCLSGTLNRLSVPFRHGGAPKPPKQKKLDT